MKSDRPHSFLVFGAKSGKKFIKISQKKCKIRRWKWTKIGNSIIQSRKMLTMFDEKIEIRERCRGVHCVDLGESFPTSIYLQKSASIQPRTSPSKFGEKFNSLFTSLLNSHVFGLTSPNPTQKNLSWPTLGCINELTPSTIIHSYMKRASLRRLVSPS